jgi:hypothetical protein
MPRVARPTASEPSAILAPLHPLRFNPQQSARTTRAGLRHIFGPIPSAAQHRIAQDRRPPRVTPATIIRSYRAGCGRTISMPDQGPGDRCRRDRGDLRVPRQRAEQSDGISVRHGGRRNLRRHQDRDGCASAYRRRLRGGFRMHHRESGRSRGGESTPACRTPLPRGSPRLACCCQHWREGPTVGAAIRGSV